MIVLVNFGHIYDWLLLIDVPQNDLTIHCTTSKHNRLSWMPAHFSDTVLYFNIQGRLLWVKLSPER